MVGASKAAGASPAGLIGGGRALGARLPCAARVGVALTTRFTRCARSAQTMFASQSWKRVSTRADPDPALLGAAHAPRRAPARSLAARWWQAIWNTASGGAKGGAGRLRRAYAAPSSAGLVARACTHAHPLLTRRDCLSRASEASGASSAPLATRLSSAGQSGPQGPTAASKRRGRPAPPFAAPAVAAPAIEQRQAQPFAASTVEPPQEPPLAAAVVEPAAC